MLVRDLPPGRRSVLYGLALIAVLGMGVLVLHNMLGVGGARFDSPVTEWVQANTFLVASVLCLLLAVTAAAQKPANSQGKSTFVSLDGARVYYKGYGIGREAIVLIHGWSCNQDYWRDQVPDLAERSRVITIDLLGHGQPQQDPVAAETV